MTLINDAINQNGNTLVKWDDKFLIGIPVIDEQHKKLVQLCQDCYTSIMESKDSAQWQTSLAGTIKACVDYVKLHFSSEEKLIAACGFEGFAAHKAQHEEFIKKIIEMSSTSATWNYKAAMDFVFFLYDWILAHVGHTDRLYVSKLKDFLLSQKGK